LHKSATLQTQYIPEFIIMSTVQISAHSSRKHSSL